MLEHNIPRDQIVLQSLNDCAREFLKSRDINHSLRTVYESCKRLIGATAGYAALLSENGTRNELMFLDMGDLPCDLDPDLPMPIRGLRARAYAEKKVVYENDFLQSEWIQLLPEGHGRLENVLFSPLVIDDRAVGILGFANKPGGFVADDVLVVKAFVELAAIGLLMYRTRQHLEKNDKHLSALMMTANDAIITIDQEGKVVFWNNAAEQCFGYSADEMVGKSCTAIIPEKYIESHQTAFARVVQNGISKIIGNRVEIEGKTKYNSLVPIELSVSKWDAEGNIFFTGIVRDISHRKQMEEKNRISEQRLREIFKLMNSGGGVYKAVDNGEDFIILENYRPSFLEDTGELDSLVGRRFLDVFPASREFGLFNVFRRVWTTGRPEFHPVTIYDDTGEIKAWRTNYVYKLSTDEIVAIYEDVTDKKQMEKALIESENLFRSIFETGPNPIALNRVDDGKFVLVNSKFLDLAGFARDEVIGHTVEELQIWEDQARREEFMALLENEWQVSDFQAQFRRKDGKILTTQISAQLLSYQDQTHILALCSDITELKKTELALRNAHAELEKRYAASTKRLQESEVRYSSLVEALLTGVYICVDNTIVFVNKQFAEMFGYTKEELLGRDMMDLIHPDDREKAHSIFRAFADDHLEDSEYEVVGLRKDGDIIYLSGRNTPIDLDGQQATLGNIANISRRKEAEKERQKSEEGLRILSARLLSAEERERKRIASDIHDSIGQTLSAIKFSVESSLLSLNDQSISSAQKALERIIPVTQQSIDEVRRIIMDLHPSTLDDLGLVATISWFCRDFESFYTNITVKRAIEVAEDDIPAPLKTVIYRILQEALNNAAKHSKTDSILLKLDKRGKNLELLIEDGGVGFDTEEATAANGSAKGLGLASMKERASSSGGGFTIQSAPGIGTRIQILWPQTE